MFTGIVEEVGLVRAASGGADGTHRIEVNADRVLRGTSAGDSICVAGVCLTVCDLLEEGFSADVMPETLARTTIGSLTAGDAVNLERAATPTTRLGGHLVQGHVDGRGAVVGHDTTRHFKSIRFSVPYPLARYLCDKGSVAVSGVSLTVVGAGGDDDGHWFSVSLIPTTLRETTLGSLATGDEVNLEVDVIAKYVERLLAAGTR